MYIPDTDIIEKVHGTGPNVITEAMVEKWFKYSFLFFSYSNKINLLSFAILDTIRAVNVLLIFLFDIFQFNVMQFLFIMTSGRKKYLCI